MRFFIASILLSLTLAPNAFSQVLPPSLQAVEGKTFNAMGPNCFATALKLAGVSRSFRGMDEPEFNQITKLFCQKVPTPQFGDVGVFEKPGFGFIHAYLYLSPGLAMQKPGVDYMGKTPISVQTEDSISYTYLASPECRRYSSDISTCSNAHYYLRCSAVQMMGHVWAEKHDQAVSQIEQRFDLLLESATFGAGEQQILVETKAAVTELVRSLQEQKDLPTNLTAFLGARLVSLKKQIEFLEKKF